MEREYDHKTVEERWMKEWIGGKYWAAPDFPDPDKKRYILTMYPYPSGDMHVGHVEIFAIHDSIARYVRMHGYEVLNPLGFDAFGLPAENAAIKRGIQPKEWTDKNIAVWRSSAERFGCSFDWDRMLATCDPEFYRWNQWLFLRFYERGLAYRKEAGAWWCPKDLTVLANEQVVGGRCELCDSLVVKRHLSQWFFKITDYADRLLDDLALNTGWSERLRTLQRNWIGRSYGAEIDFSLQGIEEPVTVFTTRPDTLWGATFFVLAPEHPLAEELAQGTDKQEQLREFKEQVETMTEIDRTSTDRPKQGMFLGKYATNPVNGERIPIWVGDYVLMDYGTGAIMAVPAHDQRDLDFARRYNLPVRVVITAPDHELDAATMKESWPHEGYMTNSAQFDGTPASESVDRVIEWLESEGIGRRAKSFRLRDWLISRQRYWGTPFPIIHCPSCGEVQVPDDQLPVVLPEVVDFRPTEAASPLATADEWVNVDCPRCGGTARRDTDTMDTFVDSSWYFHRYLDPHNDQVPFDRAKSDAWMPTDQYTGGIEHAVGHLIYARFFQKVMMDMGMVRDPEPYPNMLNHGIVTMGGKKMSKSRGNIVEASSALDRYGADALRLYMLFFGPPEQAIDWPEEGVTAIGRVTFPWLQRVWRLCELDRNGQGGAPSGATSAEASGDDPGEDDPSTVELRRHIHRTIRVVTHDYEQFSFNTAIARLMELVNHAYHYQAERGPGPALHELIEALLKMLAPMAPYLTEEQWHRLGHETSIHKEMWPEFDPSLAAEQEVTMVIQVNGKVRDTIAVPPDIAEADMKQLALTSEKVQPYLNGGEPSKIIVKPPRLISLVV